MRAPQEATPDEAQAQEQYVCLEHRLTQGESPAEVEALLEQMDAAWWRMSPRHREDANLRALARRSSGLTGM